MTSLRASFAGIAFGLGLILSFIAFQPLAGNAHSDAFETQYPEHRAFSPVEAVGQARADAVATYAMIERSELEQIAGRDNLDAETITFLEANLWLPGSRAHYATAEPTELERIAGQRNLDAETIQFLEQNLWDYDVGAKYQGPIEPGAPVP